MAMRREGFLLLADNALPSVATIVAREEIHGSWWGHPRGHAIFLLAGRLAAHRDALVLRLVSDKIAFVHRRLWPAVFAVATSRGEWQMRELRKDARELLAAVDREGELVATGAAARLLESRWLVNGQQVHTTLGSHAQHLEAWSRWATRKKVEKRLTLETAGPVIEQCVANINAKFRSHARLPWQGAPSRARKGRRSLVS
jgi:hypothetical protein